MKRKEFTEKLCEIATRVGSEQFKDKVPHDCFCGVVPATDPVVDDEVIKFIEDAVDEKLANANGDSCGR